MPASQREVALELPPTLGIYLVGNPPLSTNNQKELERYQGQSPKEAAEHRDDTKSGKGAEQLTAKKFRESSAFAAPRGTLSPSARIEDAAPLKASNANCYWGAPT